MNTEIGKGDENNSNKAEARDAWLSTAGEAHAVGDWLKVELPRMRFANLRKQYPTVIDLNCGGGTVSHQLVCLLGEYGTHIEYTGLEPDSDKRANSQKLLDFYDYGHRVQVIEGDIETFNRGEYDLAVTHDTLAYVDDLHRILTRLVSIARSTMIINPGERGLNTIRQRFARELNPERPYLLTTSSDIEGRFAQIYIGQRHVRSANVTCEVSLSECLEPDSSSGKLLISHMLGKPFDEISPETVAVVRDFIATTYPGPGHKMLHDVGIVYIS